MQIRTQYRAVLILSITIQLAFFFIVASAGLWLDQLINGIISQITKEKVLDEVVAVLTLAVSPGLDQYLLASNYYFSCWFHGSHWYERIQQSMPFRTNVPFRRGGSPSARNNGY